jgi:arylesterase/paraoxonase
MEIMKSFKIVLIVCAVLVLVVGGFVFKTLRDAGEFKEIKPHFGGECRAITGVLSSEDITVHKKTGVAFISSDDRRPLFQGRQGQQGAIYAFDLTVKNPQLVDLTEGFPQEFHPHGIGLFIGQDGNSYLFVVNHRQDGHFIEIFDYRKKQLIHQDSIQGELMHSPNDVVPVGPRSFYVTNDHGNSSELGRTLEEYLQLARSYVLYYNGRDFRVVAEGLAYANGINISRDGKTIYVAATVGKKIYVYDRDLESGDLNLRHTIDVETGIDNIEVDDMGRLWVGAHPKLLTYVAYSKDPKKLSPSQVLRISIQEAGRYTIDEIYLDRGEALSGSSVAAVFRDRLLIGSVLDDRFLLCTLAE